MSEKQVGSAPSEQKLKDALKEFFRQLCDGSLRMEHVIAMNEHRNPFMPEEEWALRLRTRMERILSKKLGYPISVDPLPSEFTPENLARWAKMNFRPVFLPKLKIDREFRAINYVKPCEFFYSAIDQRMVGEGALWLPGCWCLADFSIGVDYTDGTQIFPNDPLAETIAQLRQEKKIDKYDKTPMGSRFSITPVEGENVVCPTVQEVLGIGTNRVCRPESCIEHNFIGNLFDGKNRGHFNIWQWFSDEYGKNGAYRLFGGARVFGGLAYVDYDAAGYRYALAFSRPLVSFA